MAYPDYDNLQRAGQTNGTGDVRSLFLKLYAGEVLTSFQSRNIMMPLHRVRTISKGKSAQFPMTGKYRDAAYHIPGSEIIPTSAVQSERIVSIDDLLINAQFIPNIDEAMSHYDIRSVYTQEAGFGLAKAADENILRMAIKAGVTTSSTIAADTVQDYKDFDDEDFTENVTIGALPADVRDPQAIVQAIMDARRVLEKANVPGDPFVVLPVDLYYDLFKVKDQSVVDFAIFNRDVGGGGSIAAGQVPQILGMPIYVSNHLGSFTTTTGDTWVSNLWQTQANAGDPLVAGTGSTAAATPLTTAQGGSNRNGIYGVPASAADAAYATRGLVMTMDAVASVKLMDLSIESEYQINRQGTLMVSKYAMGHNILRPACSVALLQA